MATKIASLMCNKFGGIRRINATFSNEFISASDMQNVELFNTGINSGIGIRTAKGNISVCDIIPEDEKIINLFESVQKNVIYCFVHTENDEVGRFYLYDFISQTVTLKKDNLIKTGTSCGLDFAQGWSDLFVFSTGEEMFSIEIGAETEIVDMNNLVDIYDYTNANMDDLLNEYRNPTLDTPTNQALLQNYTNKLNKQSKEALENNIINPLANRNMIRSSQATNMYNHLADSMNESIADYTAELLTNSQNNAGNMINLLMNAYLQGHNAVNGNQALSLQTSTGNATTNGTTKTIGTSYGM